MCLLRQAQRSAALCIALGLAPSVQASLITNGSFEDASINPGAGFIAVLPGETSISGWDVITQDIHYVGTFWQASSGFRSIDLDGVVGSAGGMSQTFATVVGVSYVVTFDMSGNPANAPVIKPMLVSADGQSQLFTFDITGRSFSDMGWTPMSWSFVADDSSATLQFQSLTTFKGWGPALDNVAVNAAVTGVPEPASGLLLIAGLGLLAGVRARRG